MSELINTQLLQALKDLQRETRDTVKFNVKRNYSLMLADVAATKAITAAEQSSVKIVGYRLYTRNNPEHAWLYEQSTGYTSVIKVARDINTGAGFETLVVPVTDWNYGYPTMLCSTQNQGDFPEIEGLS